MDIRVDHKGRGASSQTLNRFDQYSYEPEAQGWDNYPDHERPLLRTKFVPDASRSILAKNDSPDIGFNYSLNPYRGCEHGCAYCYARPTHEYLGHSAGLDFESIIYMKEKAPELLREAFYKPSWQGDFVMLSGNTDCYQPIERKLQITRRCLEVFAEFRNPVGVITKNALVVRDIDLFQELAKYNAVSVCISITTLDNDLCGVLEPRTSRPQARLEAVAKLAEAEIPVSVNVAPVIAGLNDHEIPRILKAAKDAGARSAGMIPVRLPLAVTPLFEEWLSVHRPEKKEKVLNLIRDVRGGGLNDSQFGSRMRGQGPVADQMHQMFKIYARKYGLDGGYPSVNGGHFRRPPRAGDQLTLDV